MAQGTANQVHVGLGSGIPSKTRGTGGPTSPVRLSLADWKATIKRVFSEIKADRVTLVSAGMAFYWFLAVFPALIAAVGIIDLLGLGPQIINSINQAIGTTLPGSAGQLLTSTLESAQEGDTRSSIAAAVIGIGLALYSATAGMVALQEGLNIAYEVPKSRSFIQKRGVALVLILTLGIPGALLSPSFLAEGTVWSILSLALAVGSVIGLFVVFYLVAPNRQRPDWKWVAPGGLLAAAIWLAATLGFSFYVSNFGKYGETYGVQASVVVLLFWLFLSALAVMLGGELNAELERQSAIREGRV